MLASRPRTNPPALHTPLFVAPSLPPLPACSPCLDPPAFCWATRPPVAALPELRIRDVERAARVVCFRGELRRVSRRRRGGRARLPGLPVSRAVPDQQSCRAVRPLNATEGLQGQLLNKGGAAGRRAAAGRPSARRRGSAVWGLAGGARVDAAPSAWTSRCLLRRLEGRAGGANEQEGPKRGMCPSSNTVPPPARLWRSHSKPSSGNRRQAMGSGPGWPRTPGMRRGARARRV